MTKGRGGKKTAAEKPGVKNQQLSNPSMKKSQVLSEGMRRRSQLLGDRSFIHSKSKLHAASRAPRRKGEDGFHEEDEGDGGGWEEPQELVPPDDQLELAEKELKEEFTRVLTADNPHAPQNVVRFNFKESTFKQVASIDQLALHFALDSNLLHSESDEAQRQLARDEGAESSEEEEEEGEEGEETEDGGEEQKETEEGGEGGEDETVGSKGRKKGKVEKRLKNQFNYSERASQTFNNPFRDRGTMTEPPPRDTFSKTANQMEIFDAYVEELLRQDAAKGKKGKGGGGGEKVGKTEEKKTGEMQSDDIRKVAKAAKIMERMVNQNTYDDISQDFKYYEDAGDDFKEGRGTLLPLWRFRYDKARKMAVTALAWNPLYSDLFAVGHGSYEFTNQASGGMICLHSLKNASFPEFIYPTLSGVMCLDIHPAHPNLLAVGFYDGGVCVYNLQQGERESVFRSTADTGKHTDPVWQVCWQKNDMDGNLNFYSVSADGRVVVWKIVKNELQYQDVVQLTVPGEVMEGPEGTQGTTISSGTCIGFSPFLDHLFLVGSESGRVYKCSKAYTKHFLDVTKNHHMAVHALRWNPFHQKVFASCGADWTVKIWDHTLSDPMFTYDLNSVVGDVAWSPYASTVFAAVTADGKVHIFDLSINKYEPLCVQSVIQKKRTKLTHVVFNPVHPVLCVGDDRGTVLCLKLSPNLRKALREKNRTAESEAAKMEKLISFVREPLLETVSKTPPAPVATGSS